MSPPPPQWVSLADPASIQPEIHGHKSARLARLAAAGFPVPPGWALDGEGAAQAEADPGLALELAGALVQRSPSTRRWILRSSSVLEDQPGRSAAGLFRTESAEAAPPAIARALTRVAASGRSPVVRDLLDARGPRARVSILAQPHLTLSSWWTLEIDLADASCRVEGWTYAEGSTRPSRWAGALESPPVGAPLGDAVSLAARVARWAGPGAWLLEMGDSPEGLVVLQVRPAPARRVVAPDPGIGAGRPAPATASTQPPLRDDLPTFPLHAGDERETWVWDAEHAPTPLCPLLAGIFTRWLRAKPASWPSRLIQARWHDRARSRKDPGPRVLAWPPPPEVPASLAHWEEQLRPSLEDQLEGMERTASTLASAPRSWPGFVQQWLCFQDEYYADETFGPRRWAQSVVHALGRRKPAVPPAPLPPTIAARREDALRTLTAALAAGLGAKDTGEDPGETASADAIARWMESHPDHPVHRLVSAYLREHGHVAVVPWDGRGRTLDEDPWPLWREMAQRLRVPSPGTERAPRPWPPRPLPADEESAARLAARVFARCEDDDVLLSRAYAAMRGAARAVARALALSPHAEAEVFDVLPGDLETLLSHPDPAGWAEAHARGRALALHWATWRTPTSSQARTRTGLGVSPGRATGPVRRLLAAQDDGGPAFGEVLVVATITPSDAIVFGRVAALVCEGGDALGHASILAREHGVPAVVALEGARAWLADGERVLVDGDQGSVTRLDDAS